MCTSIHYSSGKHVPTLQLYTLLKASRYGQKENLNEAEKPFKTFVYMSVSSGICICSRVPDITIDVAFYGFNGIGCCVRLALKYV